MTNPQNSAVTCLNSGDLYALFGPESEGIDTWNGADSLAKKVGGNGGFPDAPLEITAPGAESGTYDAFIELSGITDIATEQGLSEDEAATLRPDYQSSPDDNVIIQAMEGSASALGFVGFAYAEGAAARSRSSRSMRAAAASSRPGTRSRTVRTRCHGRSTSTSTRRRSRATRR